MADTLNLIKEIMQSDVTFITDEQRFRPENSEVFRLWGDNRLITELTGWKPQFNIEKGFKKTIAWYLKKENIQHFKSGIYNL